jgi:transcription elongation factor GreA
MRDGAVQLTAAGRGRLEDELAHLRDVKRRELADRIEASNEHGDISDNSEYEELKEELIMTDRRIQELEYLLATAEVIEHTNNGTVALGSVVTLVNSPVGHAVMGKRSGESAVVETPGGEIVYTVKNVA